MKKQFTGAVLLPFINKKVAPWVVCFCGGLFYLFQNVQSNMINSLNLSITKTFNLTALQLGYLSSGYIYANVIFLMLVGLLIYYFSKRSILILACSMDVIGVILFSLIQSPWQIFIVTFITGLAGTFSLIACMQLAKNWFPPQRLATIVGFIGTLGGVGALIAQIPFTISINHIGWRLTLFIDALFGLVILLFIILFVKDSPSNSQKLPILHLKDLKTSIKTVLIDYQNWLIGIYITLMNLPMFILGAVWGNRYLIQAHDFNSLQAASIISVMCIGGVIGNMLLGYLSDLLKTRKMLMQACALFSIGTFLYYYFFSLSLFQFYFIFFCWGIVSGVIGLGYTLASENSKKNVISAAQGLVATLLMLGGFTQVLFSWLLEAHGKYSMEKGIPLYSKEAYSNAMMLFPIAYVIALLLTFFIKEKKRGMGGVVVDTE
jgi:MFS family permease